MFLVPCKSRYQAFEHILNQYQDMSFDILKETRELHDLRVTQSLEIVRVFLLRNFERGRKVFKMRK